MSAIYRLVNYKWGVSIVLFFNASFYAAASQWSGQLDEGGEVTVDQRTNRATVTRDGVNSQLWDGVHRLEDGSTITIRSGQIVPNETILRNRRLPEQPGQSEEETWADGKPIVGPSPCQQLVERVCGTNGQCRNTQSCSLSQQLLDMEWQERRASGNPGYTTPSSEQCQNAANDTEYFTNCVQGR